jgi:hypothetical protein
MELACQVLSCSTVSSLLSEACRLIRASFSWRCINQSVRKMEFRSRKRFSISARFVGVSIVDGIVKPKTQFDCYRV